MKHYYLLGLLLGLAGTAQAQVRNFSITPTVLVTASTRLAEKELREYAQFTGLLPIEINQFYGELRYNYDFVRTLGVYAGRSFEFGSRDVRSTLVPQVGALLGEFTGVSPQLYYLLDSRRVELDIENQYSVDTRDERRNFYYNWSDLQFKFGGLRAGGSVQAYRGFDTRYLDGGVVVGYNRGGFTASLYDFNFYKPETNYLILSVQYCYSVSKGRKPVPRRR